MPQAAPYNRQIFTSSSDRSVIDTRTITAVVVGLARSVHWEAVRLHSLASSDGRWMAWNLALAIVPVALARPVLDRIEARRVIWWIEAIVFVLMLPNTAYVVTDVVHMFDHVRNGATNLELAAVIVPIYLAYMAVGFGGYVFCIERIRTAVREWRPAFEYRAVLLTHAVCAVGIYFGRSMRINSWDVVTAPGSVAVAVADNMHKAPAIFIGFTFAALVVLSTVVELTIDGWRARTSRPQ